MALLEAERERRTRGRRASRHASEAVRDSMAAVRGLEVAPRRVRVTVRRAVAPAPGARQKDVDLQPPSLQRLYHVLHVILRQSPLHVQGQLTTRQRVLDDAPPRVLPEQRVLQLQVHAEAAKRFASHEDLEDRGRE